MVSISVLGMVVRIGARECNHKTLSRSRLTRRNQSTKFNVQSNWLVFGFRPISSWGCPVGGSCWCFGDLSGPWVDGVAHVFAQFHPEQQQDT